MQAILCLYKQVLGVEWTGIQAMRAKKDKRLPVVLSKAQALAVLEQIGDLLFHLQAKLLYGTGMRLLECLRLRIKDLDLELRHIVVQDTRGNEDRLTMLPQKLISII
jgi:integrase